MLFFKPIIHKINNMESRQIVWFGLVKRCPALSKEEHMLLLSHSQIFYHATFQVPCFEDSALFVIEIQGLNFEIRSG